ncbi:MAG: TolC family protein [Opitutaceae bacterium]
MKYRVCFAVAGLVSFVSPGFSQAPLLPEQIFPELQPILTAALQQSPRMIERNLDLESAAGDLMQSKWGLYPFVNASLTETQTRDKREDIAETLATEKLYYAFGVSQPIFYWGDRKNTAKIGEIRHKLALRQYGQAYGALAQEIRVNYLRLVVQKAQLQAIVYSQQQTELALKLAEDKLRTRAIAEAEIFHPRIAVQQAILDTDRMREAFTESKRAFRLLTGAPAPADEAIPNGVGRIAMGTGEADRLLAGFLSQPEPKTFAMEAAKSQLEIERLNYKISRNALRPKFDVVLGISQDQQSYSTNIAAKYGVQSSYIGIAGRWTIFDGFASRGATKSTYARLRKLETSYKQLTDNLGTDAQRAVRQLTYAERQLAIQEQLLDSATNFLQDRKDTFARGAIAETDVAAVQTIYNREILTTLQLRSEYLIKFSDFLALIMQDPALNYVPAQFR